MKHVHKSQDGFLYDPNVRASLQSFTADAETLPLEAAAAVRQASQSIDRLRSHGATGRGLSSGALDILTRLNAAPPEGLTIGDLARTAGVTSRNVTGLVDTLESASLAERTQDKHDRRSVRVRITPEGRAWLTSFREPTQRAMSAIFQGFTSEDLTHLRHLCLRLVANQHRLEAYLSTPGAPQ
ncbi:hypothetical protein SRB5_67290 [Streptomyces sp. RB5]|uniref:HTH marR-type domain-containing protein n=1 Tax=Streptomyces smaragdinus TaxID=2585196 RepID=A0A7K0CSV1_9ACTN|nr:MarR family transcriptional regulator [Streptomyces smaragdinus]MQY16530.1 hypothetical protein [Streptomyces smaragdinus]